MSELVTVIIPAYNAQQTIDETLTSVRSQTWDDLEILVVDDGSRDDTVARVRHHADQDSRVRLIVKENGGVASARNRGIAEARGRLIAPVDADDLWLPSKIAKQVKSLEGGGDRVGLSYSWFAVIDEHSNIIEDDNSSDREGNVLQHICMGNFVGNGSSPLIRRELLLAAGGYDANLRAQKAQGCEDLSLYFNIAERSEFAVVRERLTGYRWTPSNMSSDALQMLRSYDLVMNPKKELHPQYHAEFSLGRIYLIEWLLKRALQYGRVRSIAQLLSALHSQDPKAARRWLLKMPYRYVSERRARRRRRRTHFLSGE